MSDKKIEQADADELLKHGGDGFDEATNHFDAVQPHLDGSDMDASWRLRENRDPESMAAGTYSEGLAEVARKERREKQTLKDTYRKVSALVDDLSEEEMWEVLAYGDTVEDLEKQGNMIAGSEAEREASRKRMLAEAQQKLEKEADEAFAKDSAETLLAERKKIMEDREELERRERELLEKLKEKYEK